MGPTTAPDVTNDVTIGQQVSSTTSTPTPTSTATSISSPTSSTLPKPVESPETPAPVFSSLLSIYGYGPPATYIYLNGFGMSGQVLSDSNGYFRFSPVYSLGLRYTEFCVWTVDNDEKASLPLCIPAIPVGRNIPAEIGPLILPPTIGTNGSDILLQNEAKVNGYSLPETEVKVYIANESSIDGLIKTANAYFVPEFDVSADKYGYYEFSLPTATKTKYRIFTANKLGEDFSSKSNTLTVEVLGVGESYLNYIWQKLLSSPLNVVILAELMVIVLLSYLLSKLTTRPLNADKNKNDHLDIKKKYLEYLKNIRR